MFIEKIKLFAIYGKNQLGQLFEIQFASDIALLKDGFILFFSNAKILIIKVKFEKKLNENLIRN